MAVLNLGPGRPFLASRTVHYYCITVTSIPTVRLWPGSRRQWSSRIDRIAASTCGWPRRNLSSSQRCAAPGGSAAPGPSPNVSEGELRALQAFVDYYRILGLRPSASVTDIKQAYLWLSKRFHPDAPEGDRDKYSRVRDAYEFLRVPEQREAYDGTCRKMRRAQFYLRRQRCEEGGQQQQQQQQHDDSSSSADAHHHHHHHPGQSTLLINRLPPHCSLADVLEAIAAIGPVGRVVDAKMLGSIPTSVTRLARVELDSPGSARRLRELSDAGLLRVRGQFPLLRFGASRTTPEGGPRGQSDDEEEGKKGEEEGGGGGGSSSSSYQHHHHHPYYHARPGRQRRRVRPDDSRVLVVEGPRGHGLMSVRAMLEYLEDDWEEQGRLMVVQRRPQALGQIVQRARMLPVQAAGGGAAMELTFTSWWAAAYWVKKRLEACCTHLTVSYGLDPCALSPEDQRRIGL